MSENHNPYQSPEEAHKPAVSQTTAFGDVIKRGFSAAHGAPAGAVWMFLVFGPLQMLGPVMGALMFGSDFFEQMQTGEFEADGGQPPPEIFMMAGTGCFGCLWMPVLFFALPWVWGGTVGQIRDGITGRALESFGSHGRRNYVAMLLLFLLFIVVVIVISIPSGIVGQVVASTQVTPGEPMSTEQMRSLSRHPVNLAASIVTGLLMAGVGIMINLVASAAVARGRGIRDGLSQGSSFCARNLGEMCKLYLVYLLLIIPFAVLQWLPQVMPPTLGVAIIVGLLSGLYTAYLSIVNFGLAGSLFAARTDSHADAATVQPA